VYPQPGVTDVPPDTAISVVFDVGVAVDPNSINATTLKVIDLNSNGQVSGRFEIRADQVRFRPDLLGSSTWYQVTLSTGVRSAGGTPLSSDFSWSFRTSAAPFVPYPDPTPTPNPNPTPAPVPNPIPTPPPTGGGTPDGDGCFVPRHAPECLVATSTYNADKTLNVTYRNSCGGRVTVRACNKYVSGNEDCGSISVANNGANNWQTYKAANSFTYQYTGSNKSSSYDFVCRSRDPQFNVIRR
jgi:hypothetical protein